MPDATRAAPMPVAAPPAHPAPGGLGVRWWPVRLEPAPDELLSSWLVRLARANGAKVHTFCVTTWPGKQIWNTDLDKNADPELILGASTHTGVGEERVWATTLRGYEGHLYPRHNARGTTRWLMNVGMRHRLRRHPALQYCPECLIADGEQPHYRRRWRLSLVTLCGDHRRLLLDRCPECAAPVTPHRGELGQRSQLASGPMTLCHGCGFDLRRAETQPVPGDEPVLALQAAMLAGIERGVVDRFGPAPEFFGVLGQLLKLLCSRRQRLQAWQADVWCAVGLEGFRPAVSAARRAGGYFDAVADPGERLRLLRGAGRLLERWPDTLLDSGHEHGLWATDLLRDFADAPPWYAGPVKARFGTEPPAVTHRQRPSAVAWRQRQAAMRSFVRDHRRDWYRLPRLAERLKEEGFYAPSVHFSQIVPVCVGFIAEVRAEHRARRRDMARRLPTDSPQWEELRRRAAPVFRRGKCPERRVRATLLRLCAGHFLSARELGELLGRDPRVLRRDHLQALVAAGHMELERPGQVNDNKQAYRTREGGPAGV